MLSLAAAAALALYDSSKPKEGDVYYATVKNFHSVVLSQPGAVAVQFFDYSCSHCKALRPAWRSACKALRGRVRCAVVDGRSKLAKDYGVERFPTILYFAAEPGAGQATKRRPPLTYSASPPQVNALLERWVASVRTIVSALDADDPARVPNVPAHRAADDREQLVSMVPNDQFSFAHLVTPTHVHPALRALGLRQKELHRRFNWRGDEPVPSHLVLNHSPRIKEDALTKYDEKKKEWEARAAERRALEAPWGPPPRKKRRRKAKKEEL